MAPSTPVQTLPRQSHGTNLASTGADTAWLLLFGVLFVAGGAFLLLISRTKRMSRS